MPNKTDKVDNKDMFGKEIKTGDFIAYSAYQWGGTTIRIARVVGWSISNVYDYNYDNKTHLKPQLRVVNDLGNNDLGSNIISLPKSKQQLLHPDRSIVLDPAAIPSKYMDLLDKAL